jgi:hypothetical protein
MLQTYLVLQLYLKQLFSTCDFVPAISFFMQHNSFELICKSAIRATVYAVHV